MSLNYGDIITRAFQITKNNRSLWIFGFLAALFGGSGVPNFNFNLPSNTFDSSKDFKDATKWLPKVDPSTVISIIVIAVIAFLIIWLIALFVRALSNGALIDMVGKIEDKNAVSIRNGFKSGLSFTLPLIGVVFSIWVPFLLTIILLGAILIGPGILFIVAAYPIPGVIWLVIGGFLLLIIIIVGSIGLSIINIFANRYLVLKKAAVFESIGQGYRLLKSNLGQSLLLWLINVGLAIGQAIVLFIVYIIILLVIGLILGLPIVLLAMAVSNWLYLLLIIPFVIFLFAVSFLGGLFETFFSAYWTLAFEELQ